MHVVHVARARLLPGVAPLAEIEQELALRVELRDARAVVAVGDVEAPVGQPRHEGRPVEVRRVRAGNVRRADRLDELLAVVRELVDRVRVVIHHPHVLLRIVRADVDGVRTLEHLVPLRPLLDDVALRVHDDDAVFPAGILAELPIRRRRRLSRAPCPSRDPGPTRPPPAEPRCSRCARGARRAETARSVRSRGRASWPGAGCSAARRR